MRKLSYFCLLSLFFGAAWGQVIEVTPLTYQYGVITQGNAGYATFVVKNTGVEPLFLTDCRPSCACLVPEWDSEAIMPGENSIIRVRYDTQRIGIINKSITIKSNAINEAQLIVRVSGEVKRGMAPDESTVPTLHEGNMIVSIYETLIPGESAFIFSDDGVDCNGNHIAHHELEGLVTACLAGKLRVLERRNIEVILEEQRSGLSGIFEENTVVEAGRLAGAKYVVIPKVGCLLGEKTFNLKVVSCLDATTMVSANASETEIGLRAFYKEMSQKMFE